MCGGFIKLHRKITEWEWFKDTNTFVVFIHLLFLANWKDGRFMGYDIPRGSLVTSLSHLAKDCNLSVKEVRTALEHLKSTGEVTSKATNRFTLLTVTNYGLYQDDNRQEASKSASESANKGQTKGKQRATIEEYKNIRNKDIYIYDSNEPPLTKVKKFQKPTVEEIQAYCAERNNSVDAQRFYDYYESNGWKVGKNPMKDWKATVRTWERNNFQTNKPKSKYDVLDNLDLDSNPFDF